jgi:hypothetical protein
LIWRAPVLKYPATDNLSRFVYSLAAVDQKAADPFLRQCFVDICGPAAARVSLPGNLIPFGSARAAILQFSVFNQVPANFVLNNALQRQYLTLTLLRRAQLALEVGLDEGDNFNGLSGPAHLYQTLIRVEPTVGQRFAGVTGSGGPITAKRFSFR